MTFPWGLLSGSILWQDALRAHPPSRTPHQHRGGAGETFSLASGHLVASSRGIDVDQPARTERYYATVHSDPGSDTAGPPCVRVDR